MNLPENVIEMPSREDIETWTYEFSDGDDAHVFLEGVKEDIRDEAEVTLVDSDVFFSDDKAKWVVTFDTIKVSPAPEAA